MATTTCHSVILRGTGDKLPSIGLGLWKMPPKDCAGAVYNAIKVGYRLLDSACDYGNESRTGEGIKKALSEGLCSRKDLFVVSKLWNTFHRPERVESACRRTMADLGVDYLDLYLIHFPIALEYVPPEENYPPEWVNLNTEDGVPRMILDEGVTLRQTWEAMERLVDAGLVRNVGLCNVGALALRQISNEARIKPSVLQVEMHPLLTQKKLLKFADSMGLRTMAFSCLGSNSYVEIGTARPEDSLMENDAVKTISKRHGKTPAQVLLRWGVQRGTTVIPKSVRYERQTENFQVFDFVLTDDEMTAIDGLNQNKRFNDPGVFCEAAFGTFCPIYE